MRVFAYGLESAKMSVQRMAGVEPATCPPTTRDSFQRGWLEHRELIMFKLHGLRGESYWLGDQGHFALLSWDIRQADLGGAVVFAENCYLPNTPMLEALLDAGASAVIGGEGVNYGGTTTMQGADLLGLYFRWALGKGATPDLALRYAKMRLRLKWPTAAVTDTLRFNVYRREDDA